MASRRVPAFRPRYLPIDMMRSLFSVIALAIAIGLFVVFTQPTYDGVNAKQAKIAEYDAALAKSNALQAKKQQLDSQERALDQNDLDRLHKMLPDHVDNVRLVLDLDQLASHHGMAMQNVIVNAPTITDSSKTAIGAIGSASQKYDSLTIKFSTDGTYGNFMSLLDDLESSLRIVDLVTLTMSPGQVIPGAAEPNYHFDITLKTYWLKG